MTGYLEEAAAALREAAKAASVMSRSDAAELSFRVADGFARLAAIERGLLLPETVPAAGDAGRREP